jgi:hypothetical protein
MLYVMAPQAVPNLKKLFKPVIYKCSQQARARPFQPSLQERPGAYPRVEHLKGALLWCSTHFSRLKHKHLTRQERH